MTNPSNRLPPEYDDMHPKGYDPAFTEDISTRMRVPDNITIGEEGKGDYLDPMIDVGKRAAHMQVPEKIMLLGSDQHAGVRHDPDLDMMPPAEPNRYVGLSTPPRVLTLEERPFPTVEEQQHETRLRKGQSPYNGYVRGVQLQHSRESSGQFDSSMLATNDGLLIQDDADDLMVLKRQVAKISRHVMRLEDEQAKRSQREMVLYPLVFGYLLLQIAKWCFKNN